MAEENKDIAPERLLEMAKRGEIPVEYVDQYPTTFTKENIEKFRRGEITWGQLQGMRPDEEFAICTMGYTLFEQGRFDDARILFEGLVMANPNEPYYHAVLGAVYGKKNMAEAAVAEYTVALSQDPKNINALVNRGELYLQQGKIDHAVSDFKTAIELDPKAENPGSVRARALAAATAAIAAKVMKAKGQA